MTERANASMIIGGVIRQSLVIALVEAIEIDHGRYDWDGEPVDVDTVESGVPLAIYARELPGGMFDNVESFCVRNRLPFVRSSDSYTGSFGPERVVFRGEGEPSHYDMTESGEVILTLNELRRFPSAKTMEDWFASAQFTPPPLKIIEDEPDPGAAPPGAVEDER